ncbi:MAG TPA: Gldg family protein, partial [Parafilimonas sp.]|nr:Gldg family protein [Parafilimonas sp.]
MKAISKIFRSRYAWIFFLVLLVLAIYVSASLRYRIDLTAEKRFSLNQSTKKLLEDLDSTVDVTVFLTGDLPADYKKLSIASRDLLSEFRDVSHNHVIFHFEKPGERLSDSGKRAIYRRYLNNISDIDDNTKDSIYFQVSKSNDSLNSVVQQILVDSLSKIGVVFDQSETHLSANHNDGVQEYVIPSAILNYNDHLPVVIDLRSSRTVFKNYNVVDQEPQEDKEATLNSAEALLEYKFADAIEKLTRKNVPVIAYTLGNG